MPTVSTKRESSRKYRAEARWKIERLQTLRMHFGSSPEQFFLKAMHKLFRSATILLSYCSFCMNKLSITQAGKPGMERSVLQARSHRCTVFLGMTLWYSGASSYQGILMASAELYMLGEPAKGQYHPIQGRGGGKQQSRLPDATETGWVPPEEPLGSWSCSLNCRLVRLIYTPLCLNRLICGIRTSISQGSSFIWELQSNVSRARVCSMGWKETLTS